MTHFKLNAHESAEIRPDDIGAKHVPNNLKESHFEGRKEE